RQIGLKLRAANGCNLVYVMWRLDPRPDIEVSVKINPGAQVHSECGTHGYTKIAPDYQAPVPDLRAVERHSLHAQITGDELTAWIDEQVAWKGALPYEVRSISGPSGIRSDNLAYDVIGVWAIVGQTGTPHVADGED